MFFQLDGLKIFLASGQLFFDLLWIHRQTDLWIAIDFAEAFDLRNYGVDSSYKWQIDFHTLGFINGMFFAC